MQRYVIPAQAGIRFHVSRILLLLGFSIQPYNLIFFERELF